MRARELNAARARLGMTQKALAEALGLHPMTIARHEGGALPIPKVVALAVEALETRAARTRKTA
jgi:DNA-binding XRE family transcriptional regulator